MVLILFIVTGLYLNNSLNAQQQTISGTVKEKVSGEALIGVRVALYADTTRTKPLRGAITNKQGFFSIQNIPQGQYMLAVRPPGYKPALQPLTINGSPQFIHIALEQQDVTTNQIMVEESRNRPSDGIISTITIPVEMLHSLPSIGGEKDLFRMLQLLPGVKTANEISTGLYIRGGSPDQNLILLDGVPVYNPLHLGGFLSTFNADALRDIKLIKGAFPAEYGGRLSSVIDITMKEGTREKLSGSGHVSLLASRLLLEGPIGEKASFMISGRRTYIDLALKAIGGTSAPDYHFYDLNAKVNVDISPQDQIFASCYLGGDALYPPESYKSHEGFAVDWGNTMAQARWTHIASPSLFTGVTFGFTRYNFYMGLNNGTTYNANQSGGYNLQTGSRIEDFLLKAEAQWFPAEGHTIKIGAESTFHNFRSFVQGASTLRLSSDDAANTIQSLEAALYLQDEWAITSQLTTHLGGRLSYFQNGHYLIAEPRLSFAYKLGEDVLLKAAAAVTTQYAHLLSQNSVVVPTDTWFPSTKTIKPQYGIQYVGAVESHLFDKSYFFSAEVYYKSMKHLYEFRDDVQFTLGIPPESQFTEGTGEGYGLELFLNKRLGSFTGWLGYTLSWTRRFFPELNGGKPFYPRYDRRHDISLALTYKLNDSWEFGASWVYNTGQRFTLPSGIFDVDTPLLVSEWAVIHPKPTTNTGFSGSFNKVLFTERNNVTLPAYHRLDLNVLHKFTWFKLPFQASFNLYNSYGRLNPYAVWISYHTYPEPSVFQFTLFPILPTFGLSFTF